MQALKVDPTNDDYLALQGEIKKRMDNLLQ